MSPLDLIPGWVKLAILAALAAAAVALWSAHIHHERESGRNEIRAEWKAAQLAESEANAKETLRRITRQEESQRVQNEQLAAARRDADLNAADRDRLREQNATIARQWRDALRDSPTLAEREAAADAIGVLADVLGRADRRAGILAAYADAARAAGLKCAADYDALTR